MLFSCHKSEDKILKKNPESTVKHVKIIPVQGVYWGTILDDTSDGLDTELQHFV